MYLTNKLKYLILLIAILPVILTAQKQKVWLDTDTGNEMDDVWAIVRLLWAKEEIDIMGISSAHFNNADLVSFDKWNQYETKNLHPIDESQRLNEEILSRLNLSQIPHPKGADRQMGRAWGQYHPRPSEATQSLLLVIKALQPNEKLDILQIGAATNIASLIALDSSVVSKIRLFSMGFFYNVKNKAWNKNEFNIRCDLNAIDFMLNQPKLDWTIITADVCMPYQYSKHEILSKLNSHYPGEDLMKNRWLESNPESSSRVLWDLALIQAYLRPKFVKISRVLTPPENHQHKVKLYTGIDLKRFYEDFWSEVIKNRSLRN